MSVPNCKICEQSEITKAQQTPDDLSLGDYCPICYKPTCRRHLVTVRFRWRDNGKIDSSLVCQDCKRTYQHRYWDSARRDWIS